MNDFDACEHLLRKYGPEFLNPSAPESHERGFAPGPFRPPTSAELRARMRHMRLEGFTIGDIARACGVTWRTAWKHSAPKGGKR